jgi:DNA-directed RNA polymerase specialized sigma24 family protein
VAAQLRCSEQAARARVHRGLTRLATTLEAT